MRVLHARQEHQRPERFRHMVGIAVDDTRGLPAEKSTLRIRSVAVDSIEVETPLRAWSDSRVRDRRERNSGGCVPDLGRFIGSGSSLPPRIPRSSFASAIQVDRQVDPFSGRSHLKLAIVPDVLPVVAQKDLDDIAVPELVSVVAVRSRLEAIQRSVRTHEQQIDENDRSRTRGSWCRDRGSPPYENSP